MHKNIENIYKERENFLDHLRTDINKCDSTIQTLTDEQEGLKKLIEHLNSLKVYPEHEALIPLGKNIYVKGKLIHTGEVLVKKNAHPDPIVTLQTTDRAIKTLENECKAKEEDLEKAEYAKFQIEERIKVFKGEESFGADTNDLPKEIKSDKGVALKVGDYYEILEYEDA